MRIKTYFKRVVSANRFSKEKFDILEARHILECCDFRGETSMVNNIEKDCPAGGQVLRP